MWTSSPIFIHRSAGGVVRIGVEGDDLVVQLTAVPEEGPDQRVLLFGVGGFRWRQVGARVVEVELAVERHRVRRGLADDPGPRWAYCRLTVALRGGRGGRDW